MVIVLLQVYLYKQTKFLMKYTFSRNTKFNHQTVNYDNLDSVLI